MQTTYDTLPTVIDQLCDDVKAIKRLLEKNHEQGEKPPNRWMTVAELCDYLPDHPARATIYGKIEEIPHYKDKKRLRFLKSEIDDWLLQGKRKTLAEIDVAADEALIAK